jgi:hypothetical protein
MQPWLKDLEDTLSFAEGRIVPEASGIEALTHSRTIEDEYAKRQAEG